MDRAARKGLLVIEGTPSVAPEDIRRHKELLRLFESVCGRYDIKRYVDPSENGEPYLWNRIQAAVARNNLDAVVFSGSQALKKYLEPLRLFHPRLPILHAADAREFHVNGGGPAEARELGRLHGMVDLVLKFSPRLDLGRELDRIRAARQEARTPDVIWVRQAGSARIVQDPFIPPRHARRIADDPRALNQALLRSSRKYTLILGSASGITQSNFERMMDYAENRHDAAAICPFEKTLNGSREVRDQAEATAWAMKYSGVFRLLRRLPFHCFLLRNSAIEKAGLLDERFRSLHYAVIDYGLRLRHAGYRLLQTEEVLFYRLPGNGPDPRDRALDLEWMDEKWCRKPYLFLSKGVKRA